MFLLGLAVRLLLAATAVTLLGLWVPLCVPEPRRPDWQLLPPAVSLWLAALLGRLDLSFSSSPSSPSSSFSSLIALPLLAGLAAYASVARVHTAESLLVLRGLGIQTRSTGPTYVGELASALALVWWTLTSPAALLRVWSAPWSVGRQSAAAATTTRFIPTEQLQDLLVNEAFRGFEVRYYLVAVVRGSATGEGTSSEAEADDDAQADADHDGSSSVQEGDGSDSAHHHHHRHHRHRYLADQDEEDPIVVVFPQLLPGLDIVQQVWREARACLYEPGEKS